MFQFCTHPDDNGSFSGSLVQQPVLCFGRRGSPASESLRHATRHLEVKQLACSVRGLVGGWSFERTEFDRAMQARRQVGSAFKPLVFGAALEEGYRKIKIKIKPGMDLEYLRAARSELGAHAPLMADANNAIELSSVSSDSHP